ncbi:MAG: PHP domain-containing protein [Nitrospinae bacterium]|nr:PHP domain-containing protein [Nitrospinota bacterium]
MKSCSTRGVSGPFPRRHFYPGFLGVLLVTGLVLAGQACRSRWPGLSAIPPEEGPSSLAGWGYRDYTGVIHVHTAYSPDSPGLLSEVAEAANDRELDYVLITDHNTLRGLKEGNEGWYGRALLLIGSEVSTTDGHCLAFGLQDFWGEERPGGKMPPERLFELAKRQGALLFIAHPTRPSNPWRNWEVSRANGLEVYNLGTDLKRMVPLIHLQDLFFSIFLLRLDISGLIRKPADTLALWDDLLIRGRRMVGIGGVDAHARVRLLGWGVDSYARLFGILQTHLLSQKQLTGKLQPDKALIYEALAKGHAYLSFGLWGDATGFGFWAQAGEKLRGVLGDEVDWEPNLRLVVAAPEESRIVLLRDGEEIGEGAGPRREAKADRPGIYRVEIYQKVGFRYRLWILSNPIFLKESAPLLAGFH